MDARQGLKQHPRAKGAARTALRTATSSEPAPSTSKDGDPVTARPEDFVGTTSAGSSDEWAPIIPIRQERAINRPLKTGQRAQLGKVRSGQHRLDREIGHAGRSSNVAHAALTHGVTESAGNDLGELSSRITIELSVRPRSGHDVVDRRLSDDRYSAHTMIVLVVHHTPRGDVLDSAPRPPSEAGAGAGAGATKLTDSKVHDVYCTFVISGKRDFV